MQDIRRFLSQETIDKSQGKVFFHEERFLSRKTFFYQENNFFYQEKNNKDKIKEFSTQKLSHFWAFLSARLRKTVKNPLIQKQIRKQDGTNIFKRH